MGYFAAVRARAVDYARTVPQGNSMSSFRGFLAGRHAHQDHSITVGGDPKVNQELGKLISRVAEMNRNMSREVTVQHTSFKLGEIMDVTMENRLFSEKVVVKVHRNEPRSLFGFIFNFTQVHSFTYDNVPEAKRAVENIQSARLENMYRQ